MQISQLVINCLLHCGNIKVLSYQVSPPENFKREENKMKTMRIMKIKLKSLNNPRVARVNNFKFFYFIFSELISPALKQSDIKLGI